MDSQKDYHSINDRENKAIIQQLIEDSDDEDVAKVISCYSIGATGKDIRQKLDKLTKPVLEKAANHLQISTREKKKLQILDDIIQGIECLLKESCPVCGQYYNIELGDQPYFRCIKCNQGCHNPCFGEMHQLMSTVDEPLLNSFHFMCSSCSEYNKVPNIRVETKKHPINPLQLSQSQPNGLPIEEDEIPSGQPPASQPNISQLPNSQHNDVNTPANPTEPSQPNNAVNKAKKKNQDPQVPVCKVYKWGRCPNYDKCEFRHPPRCWDWLSRGKCRFKNDCRYHHPPLCSNSVKELKCFNESCAYFHISKTLRRNAEEETLKSALHRKNNSDQANSKTKKPTGNQPSTLANSQPPISVNLQSNSQPNNNTPSENNTEETIKNTTLSFLVTTIRDLLREDLSKELADIKLQMSSLQQTQRVTNQQTTPWATLSNMENQQNPQLSQIHIPTIQQLSQFQAAPNLFLKSSQ